MSRESQTGGGIGFIGLLAIVFITLKLMKIIAWSWMWVLAPIWMPMALFFGLIAVALLVKAFVRY